MKKLIKKLHGLPEQVKASYWYVICNVFQKGLAFITIPIYTRLLSAAEYGIYSVYITWMNIISIFATLSLSAGFFNVGILKYYDRKEKFISATQGLSTLTTVIVCSMCLIFNEIFFSVTKLNFKLLILMTIQLVFSTPLLYWSANERYEYKYVKVVFVTVFSSIFTVIFSMIFIHISSDKSYSLILGSALIQIFVGIYFFFLNIRKGKVFFDKEIWKYAVSFGIPLIPHYLSYSILISSDRVMINNMCSTNDVGIYSLACQVSVAINIVTAAIDSSLNPWVYKNLERKSYNDIRKMTNYILYAFGVIVVGCVLIAPEVLVLVAPPQYYEAKWVIPPVMLGCFFSYIAGIFMRIAFFHEKKKIITCASIVAAILNVVLNLILIPQFGYIAAAYTTVFSYIVFAIMHYVSSYVICKRNKYDQYPFDKKKISWISIGITVISFLIMLFYDSFYIRYSIFLLATLVIFVNRKKVIEIIKVIRE